MSLLALLQLSSPQLPVGTYSYSEGIEFLVEKGVIYDHLSLDYWLRQELNYGSVRIDCGILVRTYQNIPTENLSKIRAWNKWLSAQRESEELRFQNWQTGNALIKLFNDICATEKNSYSELEPCNFTVAFAIVAYHWGISLSDAVSSFLFAWVSNLVSAGIRSIPIGQTLGQKILFNLHTEIMNVIPTILSLKDDELQSCSIGLALASMGHETQYTRLFKS